MIGKPATEVAGFFLFGPKILGGLPGYVDTSNVLVKGYVNAFAVVDSTRNWIAIREKNSVHDISFNLNGDRIIEIPRQKRNRDDECPIKGDELKYSCFGLNSLVDGKARPILLLFPQNYYPRIWYGWFEAQFSCKSHHVFACPPINEMASRTLVPCLSPQRAICSGNSPCCL